MNTDLSRFKVIYGERVLKTVALSEVEHKADFDYRSVGYRSFSMLTVLVIDDNGNLKAIRDEAWRFQFIPIITEKDGAE
jgi:hypothetical protein